MATSFGGIVSAANRFYDFAMTSGMRFTRAIIRVRFLFGEHAFRAVLGQMAGLRTACVLVLLSTVGCGGTSGPAAPSRPAPPTPVPPPPFSGTVVATNDGVPLGGLTVTSGSMSATTSESGAFTLIGATAGQLTTITGAPIVSKTTRLQTAVDVFRTDTFDLEFYRKLVRDGYERPSVLQPIRRWTRTPQVYIRSVDEAGKELDAKILDFVASMVREAIPQWTSGLLDNPSITIGTESRIGTSG